jgi:hypothetical protein
VTNRQEGRHIEQETGKHILRVKNTKEHTGGMTNPQAYWLYMETERK